jgi:hypothetical protein
MPRREHARRTTAPTTKRTYTLAEMQAMVAGGGGRAACIATITESEEQPGVVFMALMLCPGSARCPTCTDARARLREWPTPPAPATRTEDNADDTDTLDLEDE